MNPTNLVSELPVSFTIEQLTGGGENEVKEINALLRYQHGAAVKLTVVDLADCIARSAIFVARHNGQIIGVVVLVPVYCLSHTAGQIHNHIVFSNYERDCPEISKQLLDAVIEYAKGKHFVHIIKSVSQADISTFAFLEERGFKKKDTYNMKLKLK